ncbi:MAG: twin-arginine translocase subunit TatC [Peptococcales bacterium]
MKIGYFYVYDNIFDFLYAPLNPPHFNKPYFINFTKPFIITFRRSSTTGAFLNCPLIFSLLHFQEDQLFQHKTNHAYPNELKSGL